MECYHCNEIITSYGSLNDGGTVICSECNRMFHPEIKLKDEIIVRSHPHIKNKGPLSCDICKKGYEYVRKNTIYSSCIKCRSSMTNDGCLKCFAEKLV